MIYIDFDDWLWLILLDFSNTDFIQNNQSLISKCCKIEFNILWLLNWIELNANISLNACKIISYNLIPLFGWKNMTKMYQEFYITKTTSYPMIPWAHFWIICNCWIAFSESAISKSLFQKQRKPECILIGICFCFLCSRVISFFSFIIFLKGFFGI